MLGDGRVREGVEADARHAKGAAGAGLVELARSTKNRQIERYRGSERRSEIERYTEKDKMDLD